MRNKFFYTMDNFSNSQNKQHLREVLLGHFSAKKTAAESHRFKSGDFDIRDKERPGKIKKFEDEELETLLDQDSSQTQEQLEASLGVTQQAISHRLKALAFIQKQAHWVPHELTEGNVERRRLISEMHLERYKKNFFASNCDWRRKMDLL